MLKRILQISVIIFVLGLIFGTQFGLPISSFASPDGAPAQESEAEDGTLQLPLVFGNFVPQHPSIFGVDLGKISPDYGLYKMREAGTFFIRKDGIPWDQVEPKKGDRNWGVLAGLDAELITANQNDFEVILIVTSTPSWAQAAPGYSCGPVKDEELPAFGAFMEAVVTRYSAPPYNVKYWELWNEPDIILGLEGLPPDSHYGCWVDKSDAYAGGGVYADMLTEVYTDHIKKADPEAQVLVGGLVLDCDPANPPETSPGSGVFKDCSSTKFLEGILRGGGGGSFDGVSFHAYDYYYGAYGDYRNTNWFSSWNSTGPVVTAKANFIKDMLASYNVKGKFLMNTETALVCNSVNPGEPPCDDDPNSLFEQTKASYVAQVYAVSLALDLDAGIWYSSLGWRNSGLLFRGGATRPAYNAYKVARQSLLDAVFGRQINEFSPVMGYEFDRNGTTVWVVWSGNNSAHTINLGIIDPTAVYDAQGNTVPTVLVAGQYQLLVGLNPIYVIWNP